MSDSKGAAIEEILKGVIAPYDKEGRHHHNWIVEELSIGEAKAAILAILAQEVNDIQLQYVSDISRAVGILDGLGQPDEYLIKQRTKRLERLG